MKLSLPGSIVVAVLAVISTTAAAQDHHQPFRVMTYNLRHVTSDDTGVYAWDRREAGILALIRANDPDVFGVQENSYARMQRALNGELGTEYGRFEPDRGSPKTIYFRRSRFERLEPSSEGTITLPNPYSAGHACHDNANGRSAAFLKLRDRLSGRRYMFVNVHTAHDADCWLARNMAAERLHRLLASTSLTIVLFGDLNVDPQRATGGDSRDDMISLLETPQDGYRLARSARHTGDTTASTSTFNSAWKSPSSSHRRYDYIFVSTADATTARPAIDSRTIREIMGSGSTISPSDHFAVRAEIQQAPFAPSARTSTRTGVASDQLSFGDVNGDGASDLIVWNATVDEGRAHIHLADGTGRFGAAIVDPTTGPRGEQRFFADVDGDGCADRIAWSATIDGGSLRVATSVCDGTFADTTARSGGSTRAGTRWSFARLDGDTCADRIAWEPASSSGRARVALAACDGTSTFGAEITSTGGGTSTHADAAMDFADVTGDGQSDQILWDPNASDGETRVFASDGDGTFTLLGAHTSGSSGSSETRFYYGDVDGDGHAEKIFWRHSYRQGRPQLYPGRASGFGAHPVMINSGPSAAETTRYHLADVDGDGSDDLITWSTATNVGSVRVYLALVHAPIEEPPLPDGGMPDADAGVSPSDDAGAEPIDAAATPVLDAGDVDRGDAGSVGGRVVAGGCSCRAGGSGSSAGWLALAVFVVLGTRRRLRA